MCTVKRGILKFVQTLKMIINFGVPTLYTLKVSKGMFTKKSRL